MYWSATYNQLGGGVSSERPSTTTDAGSWTYFTDGRASFKVQATLRTDSTLRTIRVQLRGIVKITGFEVLRYHGTFCRTFLVLTPPPRVYWYSDFCHLGVLEGIRGTWPTDPALRRDQRATGWDIRHREGRLDQDRLRGVARGQQLLRGRQAPACAALTRVRYCTICAGSVALWSVGFVSDRVMSCEDARYTCEHSWWLYWGYCARSMFQGTVKCTRFTFQGTMRCTRSTFQGIMKCTRFTWFGTIRTLPTASRAPAFLLPGALKRLEDFLHLLCRVNLLTSERLDNPVTYLSNIYMHPFEKWGRRIVNTLL